MGADGARAEMLDAQAVLDGWRESGADRHAPARFRLIDAMARRAAAHDGAARQRLDARLAELILAYADDLQRAAGRAEPAPQAEAAPGPLARLADALAAPAPDEPAESLPAQLRASYPELAVLEYFQGVWSRVSADRQVRQSQEQVHKNAGPLNSNQLVHRALSLMRELSPGYLQQFLSYTDALIWMEQMAAATAPPPKEAPRAGAKKSARGKTR